MKNIIIPAVAFLMYTAFPAPVTNSNGTVETPNSELGRYQRVVTDASSLPSRDYVDGLFAGLIESDPTIGLTNGTIYVKGGSITPLTEHQSLEPATNYTDAVARDIKAGLIESDPTIGLTNGTIYVKGGSITPLTEHQSLEPLTNYIDRVTGIRRDRDDLRVYRKVKDCWTWTNWDSPDATAKAPEDFLAFANSPGSDPIFFKGDSWFGGNQFWPNGKVKYMKGYGPGGTGVDTNLNFAFTAYAEDGTTELFRFGATATRTDPTNETLVTWSDSRYNEYIRIATTDIVHNDLIAATSGIGKAEGAARPLPKYLHALDFDDSYTNDAAWYYAQPQDYGQCSAMRDYGFLYRNYDWKFDDTAEFVVRMTAGPDRFASVGVANCGTNLTEQFVTSGKPSRYYKCLPGRTVDGINENGVVCEVNVVDGEPPVSTGGDIHPLAAVRWALDNGTSAAMVASNLASRIAFPAGWTQNFHWMVVDEHETWIVENGTAQIVLYLAHPTAVMTNFRLYPMHDIHGPGQERYYKLQWGGANITNVWYTNAYSPTADWASEFKDVDEQNAATNAWAKLGTMEARRATGAFWQTVHTSIYDITNRVLRIAVQEKDDWYTFQVPSAGGGGVSPEAVRAIVEPMIEDATNNLLSIDTATNAFLSSHGGTATRKDGEIDGVAYELIGGKGSTIGDYLTSAGHGARLKLGGGGENDQLAYGGDGAELELGGGSGGYTGGSGAKISLGGGGYADDSTGGDGAVIELGGGGTGSYFDGSGSGGGAGSALILHGGGSGYGEGGQDGRPARIELFGSGSNRTKLILEHTWTNDETLTQRILREVGGAPSPSVNTNDFLSSHGGTATRITGNNDGVAYEFQGGNEDRSEPGSEATAGSGASLELGGGGNSQMNNGGAGASLKLGGGGNAELNGGSGATLELGGGGESNSGGDGAAITLRGGGYSYYDKGGEGSKLVMDGGGSTGDDGSPGGDGASIVLGGGGGGSGSATGGVGAKLTLGGGGSALWNGGSGAQVEILGGGDGQNDSGGNGASVIIGGGGVGGEATGNGARLVLGGAKNATYSPGDGAVIELGGGGKKLLDSSSFSDGEPARITLEGGGGNTSKLTISHTATNNETLTERIIRDARTAIGPVSPTNVLSILVPDADGFIRVSDGMTAKIEAGVSGAKVVFPDRMSGVSRRFILVVLSGTSGLAWPHNSFRFLGDSLPAAVAEDTVMRFTEVYEDAFFTIVETLNVAHDRPKTFVKVDLAPGSTFDFIYIDGENDPDTAAKVWWDDFENERVSERTPRHPDSAVSAFISLENVTGPFSLYDYLSKVGDSRMVTELETDIGGLFPGYAFSHQRNVKRIVAPNVTQFANMNITTKDGAVLKYAGSGLMNDNSLEYADLSGLTNLNIKTCSSCGALKTVRLDSVTSITTGDDQLHFEKCNSIEHIYLSSMTMDQVREHGSFPFSIPAERLDSVRIHCRNGVMDGHGVFIEPSPLAPVITGLHPKGDPSSVGRWSLGGTNSIAGSNLDAAEVYFSLSGPSGYTKVDPSAVEFTDTGIVDVNCSGIPSPGVMWVKVVTGFGDTAMSCQYAP